MSDLSFYASRMITVQSVDVDAESRRVWRDGVELRLSNKEFDLLHALIGRAGEIVTREELMHEVWHTNFWTSAKTIDVHLGWVRRKLGDDPRRPSLITTVRGRGLRFETSPPSYGDPSARASTLPVRASTTQVQTLHRSVDTARSAS